MPRKRAKKQSPRRSANGLAVGYLRKSTKGEKKQAASLADQKKEALAYASQHNLEITKWFTEEESGLIANRPIFQKLTAYAKESSASTIIIWKSDRLSRDLPIPVLNVYHDLWNNGIEVHSVNDGKLYDGNDPFAFLRVGVDAVSNHNYVKGMAQNVVRAQRSKATDGYWTVGTLAFGYKIDPSSRLKDGRGCGKPIPDPATRKYVEEIFNRYSRGESLTRIARDMRIRGIGKVKAKNGKLVPKPWNANVVRELLQRPIYKGELRWGERNEQQRPDKPKMVIREEEDVTKATCPAIVTPELWDECQRIIATKYKRRGAVKVVPLFKGLLRCQHCNGPMSWQTRCKRYQCVRMLNDKDCPGSRIREDDLLALTLKALEEEFAKAPELITLPPPPDKEKIAKEIKLIQKKLTIIEDLDVCSTLSDRLKELKAIQNAPEPALPSLENHLARLHEAYAKANREQVQTLLRVCIVEIIPRTEMKSTRWRIIPGTKISFRWDNSGTTSRAVDILTDANHADIKSYRASHVHLNA